MKSRWTLVLLVASLALNLFLVGTAVGVLALGARMAHLAPNARPIPVLRRAARALSPPERRQFVVVLRSSVRASRPMTLQARETRRAMWRSLGDATFDAAGAKAKLREARALDQQARSGIEDAIIDFAAKLPPDQRARLGAALAGAMPPPAPSGDVKVRSD